MKCYYEMCSSAVLSGAFDTRWVVNALVLFAVLFAVSEIEQQYSVGRNVGRGVEIFRFLF
jgi:hypothetical protein